LAPSFNPHNSALLYKCHVLTIFNPIKNQNQYHNVMMLILFLWHFIQP